MEKAKKIKLFLGIFYTLFLGVFLYLIFSKFSFQEIASYEFIKNNRSYFFALKESNLFILALLFILFTVIWTFAAGFGTPVAIFAGFIFGKWIGVLCVAVGLSLGATLLYIFANFFFKDLIKKKFLFKFRNLEEKFKKSEFLYLLVYRFIGGLPFALANVLPCIFNVKIFNFFWATFIGIIPSLFLICSIGTGLEKIINENLEPPSFKDLISSSEIYLPLLLFIGLVLGTIFLRKLFYKK